MKKRIALPPRFSEPDTRYRYADYSPFLAPGLADEKYEAQFAPGPKPRFEKLHVATVSYSPDPSNPAVNLTRIMNQMVKIMEENSDINLIIFPEAVFGHHIGSETEDETLTAKCMRARETLEALAIKLGVGLFLGVYETDPNRNPKCGKLVENNDRLFFPTAVAQNLGLKLVKLVNGTPNEVGFQNAAQEDPSVVEYKQDRGITYIRTKHSLPTYKEQSEGASHPFRTEKTEKPAYAFEIGGKRWMVHNCEESWETSMLGALNARLESNPDTSNLTHSAIKKLLDEIPCKSDYEVSLYRSDPWAQAIALKCDGVLNMSASPFQGSNHPTRDNGKFFNLAFPIFSDIVRIGSQILGKPLSFVFISAGGFQTGLYYNPILAVIDDGLDEHRELKHGCLKMVVQAHRETVTSFDMNHTYKLEPGQEIYGRISSDENENKSARAKEFLGAIGGFLESYFRQTGTVPRHDLRLAKETKVQLKAALTPHSPKRQSEELRTEDSDNHLEPLISDSVDLSDPNQKSIRDQIKAIKSSLRHARLELKRTGVRNRNVMVELPIPAGETVSEINHRNASVFLSLFLLRPILNAGQTLYLLVPGGRKSLSPEIQKLLDILDVQIIEKRKSLLESAVTGSLEAFPIDAATTLTKMLSEATAPFAPLALFNSVFNSTIMELFNECIEQYKQSSKDDEITQIVRDVYPNQSRQREKIQEIEKRDEVILQVLQTKGNDLAGIWASVYTSFMGWSLEERKERLSKLSPHDREEKIKREKELLKLLIAKTKQYHLACQLTASKNTNGIMLTNEAPIRWDFPHNPRPYEYLLTQIYEKSCPDPTRSKSRFVATRPESSYVSTNPASMRDLSGRSLLENPGVKSGKHVYLVGNFKPFIDPNLNKLMIINYLHRIALQNKTAKTGEDIRLVVFPAFALSGQAKDDFYGTWNYKVMQQAFEDIKYAANQLGLAFALGMPTENTSRKDTNHNPTSYKSGMKTGGKLAKLSCVIYDPNGGDPKKYVVNQRHVQHSREINQYDYFEPGTLEDEPIQVITIAGEDMVFTVGEDLFTHPDLNENQGPFQEDTVTAIKAKNIKTVINMAMYSDVQGRKEAVASSLQQAANSGDFTVLHVNGGGFQEAGPYYRPHRATFSPVPSKGAEKEPEKSVSARNQDTFHFFQNYFIDFAKSRNMNGMRALPKTPGLFEGKSLMNPRSQEEANALKAAYKKECTHQHHGFVFELPRGKSLTQTTSKVTPYNVNTFVMAQILRSTFSTMPIEIIYEGRLSREIKLYFKKLNITLVKKTQALRHYAESKKFVSLDTGDWTSRMLLSKNEFKSLPNQAHLHPFFNVTKSELFSMFKTICSDGILKEHTRGYCLYPQQKGLARKFGLKTIKRIERYDRILTALFTSQRDVTKAIKSAEAKIEKQTRGHSAIRLIRLKRLERRWYRLADSLHRSIGYLGMDHPDGAVQHIAASTNRYAHSVRLTQNAGRDVRKAFSELRRKSANPVAVSV